MQNQKEHENMTTLNQINRKTTFQINVEHIKYDYSFTKHICIVT